MKSEFKNKREVADYLIEEGWKVSRSTVYKHAAEGRIRPDANGIYTLRAVQKYARLHLMQQDTGQKIDDEELQRKKIMAEVAWKTEQARREKLKRMVEEGLYILREDLHLEFAARTATLEAGLRHMVHSSAGDWIALVDGNEKKVGDLIREINGALDALLNEYATTKEFEVIFSKNECHE